MCSSDLYILTPRIFDHLRSLKPGTGGELQLTDAIQSLLAEEQVLAYRYRGQRFDCGSKLGYLKANVAFGLRHPETGRELAYGARTLIVKGDFDDCLRLARESSRELGVYLANSINPWRVEGQKTIVFEMLQQLGWHAPDWIVLPGSNLGNTSAFGKALREAHELGLIAKMPRIAVVQAEGADGAMVQAACGFGMPPTSQRHMRQAPCSDSPG